MKRKQVFFIIIYICMICITISACKKKTVQDTESIDITEAPTAVPTQTAQTREDNQTQTNTVEIDTLDSAETTKEYISKQTAEKSIRDAIRDDGYSYEIVLEELTLNGRTYYEYQISDGTSAIGPNILVDKVSEELFCYYSDGSTKPISDHPLYTEPTAVSNETVDEFTKEDALAKLKKLSAKTLGLPEKLNTYAITYDNWTTNVNGVECYSINVFTKDKAANMGVFYVAVDGSKMYRYDSALDDIVEITVNK